MRILLCVDPSSASQTAACEIASRPWPPDTTVDVVSVVDAQYDWDVLGLRTQVEESAWDAVQRAIRKVCRAKISVNALILHGDPKTMLLERAKEVGSDWIVMGTHDVGGFTGFLLGSVSRTMLHHAPCSVEIVRPTERRAGMKVLLATDDSAYSRLAVRSIVERPWPPQTEVRVLSAVELPIAWFRTPYPPYFNSRAMEDFRAETMGKSQAAVAYAEQLLSDAGLVTSSTVAVPAATPKEIILKEADDWGADLIVAGSHGRGAAGRFLIGSVSEAVALHAPCSVEIVRARQSREN